MSGRNIYLDNNATTRALPEVIEAVAVAMGEQFGNASSSHSVGDRARTLLGQSRECVAALIGAEAGSVFFNSGGTEGNNTALSAVLSMAPSRRRIVTTTIEHSSVIKMCDWLEERGVRIARLASTSAGRVDLDQLRAALDEPAGLVSLQWVNNETGVVQPIQEAAELCRERDVLFHVDGAQAVGKLTVNLQQVHADFLTFSGHKFHGPQGVGGLYARDRRQLASFLHGGPQEDGMRAGTENLPGIVGLGKAAELRAARFSQVQERLRDLRDSFEGAVLAGVPAVQVNGDVRRRVCNTTNLRFDGVDALCANVLETVDPLEFSVQGGKAKGP